MKLLIAHNPHTEKPENLWKILDDTSESAPSEEQLDKQGLELLKAKMSGSPRMIIK